MDRYFLVDYQVLVEGELQSVGNCGVKSKSDYKPNQVKTSALKIHSSKFPGKKVNVEVLGRTTLTDKEYWQISKSLDFQI